MRKVMFCIKCFWFTFWYMTSLGTYKCSGCNIERRSRP
jgi:hypothetical protein